MQYGIDTVRSPWTKKTGNARMRESQTSDQLIHSHTGTATATVGKTPIQSGYTNPICSLLRLCVDTIIVTPINDETGFFSLYKSENVVPLPEAVTISINNPII